MTSLKIPFVVIATLSLFGGALGHSEHETEASRGESPDGEAPKEYPPTYFTLDTSQLSMKVHVSLMIISWVILLPMATMLSLARSRYTHLARLVFTTINIVGVLFGVSYKNSTPDMYPGNAHSAVGWIATGITAAQLSHILVDPVRRLCHNISGRGVLKAATGKFYPKQESMGSPQDLDCSTPRSREQSLDLEATRPFLDGGDALSSSLSYQEDRRSSGYTNGDDILFTEPGSIQALHQHPLAETVKMYLRHSTPFTSPMQRIVLAIYNLVDRIILIVAFVAFCTGIITFWGLFKDHTLLNGIAHWIKGGVFFWLGIFNLGRWCGCFAELGWAWNTQHATSNVQPWMTVEFLESSLILFYGCTNIFLEHLSGWGKTWTPRDLEHVAITVLFIGGGSCGVLVEYVRVRGLGGQKDERPMSTERCCGSDSVEEHKPSGVSINPLPALVIFLMGGTMASHKQASMISTMVHKQWGNLLRAASIARLLTYAIMYLKAPTSSSPSRPPMELISAFCLISGGMLFMASSADTVNGMIHFEVDPMALYTGTMGLTGVLMSWIMALLALKGWASR